MKKYWIIYRNSLQNHLVYRFDIIASLFVELINTVVLFYIWFSIYSQGDQLGSYSLRGLLVYFVLTRFFALVMSYSDMGRMLRDEIREGKLINFILKPINYFWRTLHLMLGRVTLRAVLFSPVLVGCLWHFSDQVSYSPSSVIYFCIAIILGLLLNFIFFFIVGILTFFLDDISGINYLAWLVLSLFSGRTLPLDLFPQQAQSLIDAMPFKYISYFPTQVLTGKLPVAAMQQEIVLALLWLLAMSALAWAIYGFGIKRYEAYGI